MEDEKKVYMGNLEFSITEDELKKIIEEKGINVKEVKIIKDKFSDKSKGFGFAEFETAEDAQKTIEALNEQELKGRPLRVSKARKMSPRSENRRDNFGNQGYSGERFRR